MDRVHTTQGQVDFAHRAFHWAHENQALLVGLLVAVLVVFAVLLGSYFWTSHRRADGWQALYKAQKIEDGKARQDALEKVVQHFGRWPSAQFARWELAKLYTSRSEWQRAQELYQQIYERAGSQSFLRVAVLKGIASIHESMGDWKAAAKAYERLANEPGNRLKKEALFLKTRMFEPAGKYDEANKEYKELLKLSDLDPFLKERIEERLVWIEYQKASLPH